MVPKIHEKKTTTQTLSSRAYFQKSLLGYEKIKYTNFAVRSFMSEPFSLLLNNTPNITVQKKEPISSR